MSQQGTIFRILVAAPFDCAAERRLFPEVVYSWNAAHSVAMAAVLEPVLWQAPAEAGPGQSPAPANNRLVEHCDMMVATFWTTFGGGTGDSEPDILSHVARFRDAGKPVFLYFSAVPVALESIDKGQYARLVKGRRVLETQGAVFRYRGAAELREMFQRHLTVEMSRRLKMAPSPGAGRAGSDRLTRVKMLRAQLEELLHRLEADWDRERNKSPQGVEEAQHLLAGALEELLSFRAMLAENDGRALAGALDAAARGLRTLSRLPVLGEDDGSRAQFWERGRAAIGSLRAMHGRLGTLVSELER